MKVNFKLLIDKPDEKGLCPIFIRSSLFGEPFKYFSGEKCLPSHWNSIECKIERGHKGYKEGNQRLEKLKSEIDLIIHDFKLRKIKPSVTMVKNLLAPTEINKEELKIDNDFIPLYEEFLNWSEENGKKESTITALKSTLNLYRPFNSKGSIGSIKVSNYTSEYHESFIDYLMDSFDYQPNTIGKHTKNLISFFNWCKSEKKITLSEEHPKLSVTKIEVEKIFLTDDELDLISSVELPETMDKVRDVFLFSCYTGLRYTDLKTLRKENIICFKAVKILSFTPAKSNSFYKKLRKKLEIALIPEALSILNKYMDSHEKALPVISNQKMNEYLKEIGKLAGVTDLIEIFTYKNNKPVSEYVKKFTQITCHSARHTFATQSLSRGVPPKVVQEVMGHSDIETTMIYAKLVDDYKHHALLNAWKR
jgi:integrase/recombinase XerD